MEPAKEFLNHSSVGMMNRFFDRAAILFLVLDTRGTILKTNPFSMSQLGHGIEGRPFNDIILDFYDTFDLGPLKKDPLKVHPLNIKRPNGMPQTYNFRFETVGNFIYAFGELDHDELESVRKEVFGLNEELNNLTRELHKKNAQLGRLNREKNQFLGMAAHDLRKPIGLIMTYAEFIADEAGTDMDPEHLGFLETIQKSASFMKRLVDDFLDVSAIEAGKFDLELHPGDMTDALSQSLALNRLQATKKGIELQVNQADTLPRILMDASKIEQVITNLVSNAIEHTAPETQVRVTLESGGREISFCVADQGPGIPADELDRLFKPFAKTSVKKTGGEKSTGLGMVITRKIIEAHQGRIWVESKVGEGTHVYFTLPCNGGG